MKSSNVSLCVLVLGLHTAVAGTLPGVRSIKITNTRADWFYLEELSIHNEAGTDVASIDFGTTATASEDPGFFSTVEGPIDNIIGDCCETGWHSSSSLGTQSYTLTFATAQTLTGNVEVWDRQDSGCCSQRLDGMLFEYFDGPDGTGNLVGAQQVDALAEDSFGEISTEVGASFEITNPDTDNDGDGLTNRYEEDHDLDPNDATGDNGAEGDPDKDGSSNADEFVRGTHPRLADTDDDGLVDGVESATGVWVDTNDTGTDPLNPDSDNDTLLDGAENNSGVLVDASNPGTDPNKADSDGDGFRDHRELALGTDPNNAESLPVITASITGVKSIRITNTLVDWFYLEELEIFNTADQDVASEAFGTTATASENPGFGAKATGPIDDVIGPCCANGYHSSTELGEQSLTYTFPTAQDLVGDIRLWNRVDGCCSSRLDGMLIEYFTGDDGTGELIAEQEIDGIGSDQAEAINSPLGATVPLVFVTPTGPLVISELTLDANGALRFAWNSSSVEFFAIERSLSLRPGEWGILQASFAAAPEPASRSSFEVDRPVDPSAFYRVRRVDAPPFLIADFEDGAGEWVISAGEDPFPNQAETQWEVGVPSSGPGAAFKGQSVFATDLDADYADLANILLTSPVVDLSAQRKATLTFQYFLQSGAEEGVRLEFIDAADGATILAQTEPLPQAAQTWTLHEIDLDEINEGQASVIGQTFRVRFRFLSDQNSDDNGAGFYLDDVLIKR